MISPIDILFLTLSGLFIILSIYELSTILIHILKHSGGFFKLYFPNEIPTIIRFNKWSVLSLDNYTLDQARIEKYIGFFDSPCKKEIISLGITNNSFCFKWFLLHCKLINKEAAEVSAASLFKSINDFYKRNTYVNNRG